MVPLPNGSPTDSSETVACLLCGGTISKQMWLTRDRLCHCPGEFPLVKCLACGLVYLSPRPTRESIQRYYPTEYQPYSMVPTEDLALPTRLSVRYGLLKRCRFVKSFRDTGRLLDIGCGTGHFLAAMRRIPGWEVVGVEPSETAYKFARERYGLCVHLGDLESASFQNRTFDVVTMWDTLEHLHNPIADLLEVKRILKSDGYLIVRTPSLDSLDALVFGQYWQGLDSPRHLAIFTRRTLTGLLEKAGFTVETVKTGTGSYFVWHLSFCHWANDNVRIQWLRRGLLRCAGSWPARLLALGPLLLIDTLGRGSEVVIAARPSTA